MLNIHELFTNPKWLLYHINTDKELAAFLQVSRTDIRKTSCLSIDNMNIRKQPVWVPLAELANVVEKTVPNVSDKPPQFIFHTAFCSSTFLSRCFDVEGKLIALREPLALMDAANAKRSKWQSKDGPLSWRELPELVLRCLQKHANDKEQLLIKPINTVNNIIPELLHASPNSKALILFNDARNFLLSSLRKGEGGKRLTRLMFDQIRKDFEHLSRLRLQDIIPLTDMTIICTLWRLHIEQVAPLLNEYGPQNRLRSVYGERLINDAKLVLQETNQFLNLDFSDKQLQTIINAEAFSEDSKKKDEQFSTQQRELRFKEIENFYGHEISGILDWMVKNNPQTRLKPELSFPLDSGN
jgi:hypothetical protein